MRVVIPSVNYADLLAVTLPAWRSLLPEADLRVVTTREDRATHDVAHWTALVWETEAWGKDGAAFNKAAALDDAFGFAGPLDPPKPDEWCLALDADVFPLFALPPAIEARVLYSCDRRLCPDTRTLKAIRRGQYDLDRLKRRNTGDSGSGYFQLFRYQPGIHFGSFPSAGHYDLAFHRHFDRVENLADRPVLHLGPTDGKHNWHGTRSIPIWGAA